MDTASQDRGQASEAAPQLYDRFLGKVGAAMMVAVISVAERSGLFRAMRDTTPMTLDEIVAASGLDRRYVREMLSALAADGIIAYDEGAERFHIRPADRAALCDETSPEFVGGWGQYVRSMYTTVPQVAEAARKGTGIPYETFGSDMSEGLERMEGQQTLKDLVQVWLPHLPHVVRALEEPGARAADIGCGTGVATRELARAFPNAEIIGYDTDPVGLERARAAAAETGVDNVRFEQRDAIELPTDEPFDFLMCLRTLHDLPHPLETLQRARAALKPRGSLFVVEPHSVAGLAGNLTPQAAFRYASSVLHCLPVGLLDGGEGLGAEFSPDKAESYARRAGFSSFRRLRLGHPDEGFYELRPY